MLDLRPSHGRYTLRPVCDDDEAWMWPAGKDALRPYVEPIFGWDEAAARFFFEKSWRKRLVVKVGETEAGWVEVAVDGDWLYLHEIGLLSAYRNQGLGSCIIEDVIGYADKQHLNVELQVLVTNPARRLYERLGFRQTHQKMSRPPGGWSN